MNSPSYFQLSISLKREICFFSLVSLGNGENRPIQAFIEYPKDLDFSYGVWSKSHKKATEYKQELDTFKKEKSKDHEVSELSPGYVPDSFDWESLTTREEENLLNKFEEWLDDRRLLEIRQKILNSRDPVTLLIAYDTDRIMRLPWEKWNLGSKETPSSHVRICRTPINFRDSDLEDEHIIYGSRGRRGNVRILMIVADASNQSDFQSDAKIDFENDIRVVKKLLQNKATVEIIKFSKEIADNFKEGMVRKIKDERGWDILIFSGHSYTTQETGSILELSENKYLNITDLEEPLIQAVKRGLRTAVFNSCGGEGIAQITTRCGLSQTIIMREPIDDLAAQFFLERFCQNLVSYKDVYESMHDACKSLEQFPHTFPSAHLIPSLFLYPSPQAKLFQFERSPLERFWRDWQPSRGEAIASGIILLLSLMVPVQELLLDFRYLSQAIFRDVTTNLKQQETLPPTLLIAIDQESIRQEENKRRKETPYIEFKRNPIDRLYLAKLIQKLSSLKSETIGIDYLLETLEEGEKQLAEAIKSTVREQRTNFVFAASYRRHLGVNSSIASPQWSLQGDADFFKWEFRGSSDFLKWSLQGDTDFFKWDLELPDNPTCAGPCPFAYLLATKHSLNLQGEADIPQPTINNKEVSAPTFQTQISQYLRAKEDISDSLKRVYSPFGLSSIIDFSIPPSQAYEFIPAHVFMTLPENDQTLQQKFQQQIALIASGGYLGAEDRFANPLALKYWCDPWNGRNKLPRDCPSWLNGGEVHAYMTHHILTGHRVTRIPDFWISIVAGIFGKWMALQLLEKELHRRQQWSFYLLCITMSWWALGLIAYRWFPSVLMPLCLPTSMFWTYIMKSIKRSQNYA